MSRHNYIGIKWIKKNARELRSNLTYPEKLLWNELRNRKFEGLKFLRQHPILYKADFKGINYFIADFYCHEKKIVIELDGPIHEINPDYDSFRDNEMNQMGITVIRIQNSELENINTVLCKIRTTLNLTHSF